MCKTLNGHIFLGEVLGPRVDEPCVDHESATHVLLESAASVLVSIDPFLAPAPGG